MEHRKSRGECHFFVAETRDGEESPWRSIWKERDIMNIMGTHRIPIMGTEDVVLF